MFNKTLINIVSWGLFGLGVLFLFSSVQKYGHFSPLEDSLVCVPASVSLGIIASGKQAQTEMIISNQGSRSYEITKITPGCHCTSIDALKLPHTLKPGQDLIVPIVFSAMPPFRDQETSIFVDYVEIGNEQLKRTSFSIQAQVASQFVVVPEVCEIQIVKDSEFETTITIQNREQGVPVKVKSIVAFSPNIHAELLKTDASGGQQIRLYSLGMEAGEVRSYATVEMESSGSELVHILINGVVKGDIVAEPGVIDTQEVSNWPLTVVIKKSTVSSSILELQDIDSPIDIIQSIESVDGNIVLEIAQPHPPGTANRKSIRVMTSLGDLQIPILD